MARDRNDAPQFTPEAELAVERLRKQLSAGADPVVLDQCDANWLLAEIDGGRDSFAVVVDSNRSIRGDLARLRQTVDMLISMRDERISASDQRPQDTVWKATTRSGETCHFGVKSIAGAWAGACGQVEPVAVRVLPCVSEVPVGDAKATIAELQRLLNDLIERDGDLHQSN